MLNINAYCTAGNLRKKTEILKSKEGHFEGYIDKRNHQFRKRYDDEKRCRSKKEVHKHFFLLAII